MTVSPSTGVERANDWISSRSKPALEARDPLVGEILGGVQVMASIAASSMSEVYLGIDVATGEKRIVKVCRHPRDGDHGNRSRFSRELALHSKIQSPHVPRICAAGRFHGTKFLVMEHVSGHDLTATLQDCRVLGTPLPIEDILHLALDVATGLKHIADAGIVHRDIKPSNILISEDGQAKIIDFGIATTIQEEQFTDDNHVLGTFGYMSPEQWSGQVVDQRSDIYSFGIVLFEMAAGVLSPQRSDLGYAVHPEFACDRMLLRRLRPDIPKGLDDIIEQCLRRDRRLRYHGFESLVRDLGLVIDGLHAPRRPLTALWMVRPRWHHLPEAVIVVLLLCVAAIYVLL